MAFISVKDFTTSLAVKLRTFLVNTDENVTVHGLVDSANGEILGTKTDAANTATNTTAVSMMSVFKQISASIQATATALGAAVFTRGGGVKDANTLRVTVATDDQMAPGPALMAASTPVTMATDQTAIPVGGFIAHGATDSGNPIKLGGKAFTGIPTPVSNGQRSDGWLDEYGRIVITDKDNELGVSTGTLASREMMVAERYAVLADSLADAIGSLWAQSTANGGTVTTTGGEGLLKTSTATNGSSQIVSTNIPHLPGQVSWMSATARFGDTGTAGDIRRLGVYTVSGTTPQDGFYFELNGTTLNAVTVKAGSATAVAQASWTRNGVAPFTLDTNYHSYEIRYGANTVWFYIDGVLRHSVAATTAPLSAVLSLPMAATNIKTSGATDITMAIRNIGAGRFGDNVAFDGAKIVRPHAPLEDLLTNVATSTAGANVSGLAAPGAGYRIYLCAVLISNTGGAASGQVSVTDGSGGTEKANIPYTQVGAVENLPVPIPFSFNTAVFVDPSGSDNMKITLIGFRARI